MTSRSRAIYIPSLRMKKGELEGLRALRSDVAACIVPLLVIPPLRDRDSAGQENLFPPSEPIPDVGGILSRFWPRRPTFVDPSVLLKEHGLENCANWLPGIFSRAFNLGVIAIPVASLADIEAVGASVFRELLPWDHVLKLGLRIQSGEMTDEDLPKRIAAVLSDLGLTPQACAVFSDFSDADISEHQFVAPIIRASLEQLQELGNWKIISFQATHYPEKNPAKAGETVIHPRNEWLAWREAVKFDPSTAEHMLFGDFAADSSKLEFGTQGAKPIPHCRYATDTHWYIVRGKNSGNTYEVMKDVFRRIVDSGKFSGRAFSEADAYIDDVANGNSDGAGNASTWRQINTTHHITRVVADIASVRGIVIAELPAAPSAEQLKLLPE